MNQGHRFCIFEWAISGIGMSGPLPISSRKPCARARGTSWSPMPTRQGLWWLDTHFSESLKRSFPKERIRSDSRSFGACNRGYQHLPVESLRVPAGGLGCGRRFVFFGVTARLDPIASRVEVRGHSFHSLNSCSLSSKPSRRLGGNKPVASATGKSPRTHERPGWGANPRPPVPRAVS